MPSVVTPKTTITYSPSDIVKLILADLKANYSHIKVDEKTLAEILTGGRKDCDCDSWGGPSMPCRCLPTPVKFNGYSCIGEVVGRPQGSLESW